MTYILAYSYGDGTRYTVSGGADAIWHLAFLLDRAGRDLFTFISIVDSNGSHIDYRRGIEMLVYKPEVSVTMVAP